MDKGGRHFLIILNVLNNLALYYTWYFCRTYDDKKK